MRVVSVQWSVLYCFAYHVSPRLLDECSVMVATMPWPRAMVSCIVEHTFVNVLVVVEGASAEHNGLGVHVHFLVHSCSILRSTIIASDCFVPLSLDQTMLN